MLFELVEVGMVLEGDNEFGVEFLDVLEELGEAGGVGRERGRGSLGGTFLDGGTADGLGDDELVFADVFDVVLVVVVDGVEIDSHAFQQLERRRAYLLVESLL